MKQEEKNVVIVTLGDYDELAQNCNSKFAESLSEILEAKKGFDKRKKEEYQWDIDMLNRKSIEYEEGLHQYIDAKINEPETFKNKSSVEKMVQKNEVLIKRFQIDYLLIAYKMNEQKSPVSLDDVEDAKKDDQYGVLNDIYETLLNRLEPNSLQGEDIDYIYKLSRSFDHQVKDLNVVKNSRFEKIWEDKGKDNNSVADMFQ